jgi:REP element-mobilizing transposase RayT
LDRQLEKGLADFGRVKRPYLFIAPIQLELHFLIMLPERKQLPHGMPPWVEEGSIFFITINCLKRGTNSLCSEAVSLVLKEAITYRCQQKEWWVHCFQLMPDHCHGLISFSRDISMQQSVANWKRFTARKIGFNWQRDFFDHRIRNVHELHEKEMYIRMNPVRKALCKQPEDWPYYLSSMDFEI